MRRIREVLQLRHGQGLSHQPQADDRVRIRFAAAAVEVDTRESGLAPLVGEDVGGPAVTTIPLPIPLPPARVVSLTGCSGPMRSNWRSRAAVGPAGWPRGRTAGRG